MHRGVDKYLLYPTKFTGRSRIYPTKFSRRSRSGRFASQRGVTLIVVMGICLCMVVIALYFSDSMLMEYRASDYNSEGREAAQAIEGTRRYIGYVLKSSDTPGYLPDPASYENEAVKVNNATYWIIGRGDENTDGKTLTFGLVSEASKLNLNTATLEMLEALPGMSAELAASIIDWRDPDSDPTPNGVESNYYLSLGTPYNCKNAPFETAEELRAVMGGNRDVLYGEDLNQNGILDANENDGDTLNPPDNADGILDPGLLEYVTVYSREPNKRADGSARINITTQRPPRELMDFLQQTLGSDRANQIIGAMGPDLNNIRSTLEFCVRSKMTPAEFAQISDALTVSSDQYLRGLVNVNTASAKVLACIPGLDSASAEKLVAARRDKSSDEMKCLAWVVGILDENICIQAGPYLTTRSYQFHADIAAVGENGRGYRRDLMTFDTSGGGDPVVVYRKDMSRFGWALGAELRKKYSGAVNE